MNKEMYFHFEGELIQVMSNEDTMSDGALLETLSEYIPKIEREIASELRDMTAHLIEERLDVHVNIRFHKGSVLFSGVVIVMNWMARISGAISLIQMIADAIRWVVRRVLQRYVRNRKIQVSVFNPIPTVTQSSPQQTSVNQDSPLFSLRSILLAITLLNAVLFVGGTVYTGISVNSIQQRYKEAQTEIKKVQADYENYKKRIEANVGDVEGDLMKISNKTSELSETVTTVGAKVDELDKKTESLRLALKQQSLGWVTIGTVFEYTNWPLRIIIGLLLLVNGGVLIGLIILGYIRLRA